MSSAGVKIFCCAFPGIRFSYTHRLPISLTRDGTVALHFFSISPQRVSCRSLFSFPHFVPPHLLPERCSFFCAQSYTSDPLQNFDPFADAAISTVPKVAEDFSLGCHRSLREGSRFLVFTRFDLQFFSERPTNFPCTAEGFYSKPLTPAEGTVKKGPFLVPTRFSFFFGWMSFSSFFLTILITIRSCSSAVIGYLYW